METAKKAEAVVRLYKMSKRVKKGTHDADVINFIMNNQQNSAALAPLSDLVKEKRIKFKNYIA